MELEYRDCMTPDPKMLARIQLEDKILQRYESLREDDIVDRLSLIMDLEYSGVDLEKLLAADDKTLLHDVNGIMVSMNRKEKKLENFMPRVGLASK